MVDRRVIWGAVAALIAVVLVFVVIRLVVDVPNVVAGRDPGPQAFERRYALHPAAAYAHVLPGVLYLLLAPLQLSRRFRTGHRRRHRRLGRIALAAGATAGVLAVVVGVWFPYGGPVESAAAVVFGCGFTAELALAWRAIRRRDATAHRRWMIRAFAVGLGVGTIRIWVGIFQAVGLLAIQRNAGAVWFGVAFWVALLAHAAVAEAYLRVRPAG